MDVRFHFALRFGGNMRLSRCSGSEGAGFCQDLCCCHTRQLNRLALLRSALKAAESHPPIARSETHQVRPQKAR